jgi:hypothetical protein
MARRNERRQAEREARILRVKLGYDERERDYGYVRETPHPL